MAGQYILQGLQQLSNNYGQSKAAGDSGADTYFNTFHRTKDNTGSWGKAMAGNVFDPLNVFGFFGKNGKGSGIQLYEPPPYTGQRPYSGEQVGYGADTLKGLAEAYLPELQKRAMGEGVGFDPRRRETLRTEFLKDFGDYQSDVLSKASQQASGQGLRGGIPIENRQEIFKDLGRARESSLAGIDIEDLEARREDQNLAFYQLPEEVTRGSGIQQNRAAFDLAEYEATSPQPYIQEQSPSVIPYLAQAAASYLGSRGNEAGTNGVNYTGNASSQAVSQGIANKSLGRSYLGVDDPSAAYADFLYKQRRPGY